MATLMVPRRRGGGHVKSDSEAVQDLEMVFTSVDIDGSGRLDQGSFATALLSLNVKLPESEMDAIFEELDTEGSGSIEYAQFLSFLQMGKIPSSLLNRLKTSKTPRKSIVFGMAAAPGAALKDRAGSPGAKKGVSLLPMSELKALKQEAEKKEEIEDPARRKMMQRAVIVIKKAAMKNIKRPEVIEFLMDKGMEPKDIEIAFSRAQETVMSGKERLKYLQELVDSHKADLKEEKSVNSYLTNDLTRKNAEIDLLRGALRMAINVMGKEYAHVFEEKINKTCASEINEKLTQVRADMDKAKEDGNSASLGIYEKDLETLQSVARYMSDRKHFQGYLLFLSLDETMRDSMPSTSKFLSDYAEGGDE